MQKKTPENRIRDLMALRLGWRPTGFKFALEPPFEISRPNIHDSKKEFLLERNAVRSVMDHIMAIGRSAYKSDKDGTPEHNAMAERLEAAIDANARRGKSAWEVQSATDLIRNNAAEVGLHYTGFFVLADMYSAYHQRLVELREQEAEFWSVGHRPPKYYARTIALRFAKFYVETTRTRPTFGTARDGGHPSTDYGRILQEVFEILEIDADVRGPAEWAIAQIKDEDVNPINRLASRRAMPGCGRSRHSSNGSPISRGSSPASGMTRWPTSTTMRKTPVRPMRGVRRNIHRWSNVPILSA